MYILRDKAVVVFCSIKITNEQFTSFGLLEVIKFKQSLEISYHDLLWFFDVGVDKTVIKPAKIMSI